MKRFALAFFLVVLIAILTYILINSNQEVKETTAPSHRQGVAIIMTGAAARIPQEAALLEELDRRGLLKDVVFISGVSSGALNAVMLNGILDKKINWTDYRKILYGITNKDIFEPYYHNFPLNTAPARKLYTRVVEGVLGYHTIGDLPVTTSISFVNIKRLSPKRSIYRMCSRKLNEESDTTLNLVDILMASSAFPIVFPPAQIRNAKTIPDVEYVDGGVGEDQVPFRALLEFEKKRGIGVEKVYIISRKGDSDIAISHELKGMGIEDSEVLDQFNISYDYFLKNGIIKKIQSFSKEAPSMVPLTYVWIPDFKEDFPMFNFDNLKKQYEVTSRWAKKNNPVPLARFLQDNAPKTSMPAK